MANNRMDFSAMGVGMELSRGYIMRLIEQAGMEKPLMCYVKDNKLYIQGHEKYVAAGLTPVLFRKCGRVTEKSPNELNGGHNNFKKRAKGYVFPKMDRDLGRPDWAYFEMIQIVDNRVTFYDDGMDFPDNHYGSPTRNAKYWKIGKSRIKTRSGHLIKLDFAIGFLDKENYKDHLSGLSQLRSPLAEFKVVINDVVLRNGLPDWGISLRI